MLYKDFKALLNAPKSLYGRIEEDVKPENKQTFYKRVWGYIQKQLARQIDIAQRLERVSKGTY